MNEHQALKYAYRGGLAFLLVEIPLWILATIAASSSPTRAFVLFFIGGILIAPLALLAQKFIIRRKLDQSNSLLSLSTQLALVIPLMYPLVYVALQANSNLVLAAIGVVVGAHYLPFYYVYKMVGYIVAGVALVAGNSLVAHFMPEIAIAPGIFSASVLCALAVYLFTSTQSKAIS